MAQGSAVRRVRAGVGAAPRDPPGRAVTVMLRALLVDDSADDAAAVARALHDDARTLETARVETTAGLREALAGAPWDVILCEWTLAACGALAALEAVAQAGLDVPVVVVSHTAGEAHAVAALRAGAHDYVRKDALARLAPAVAHAVQARAAAARSAGDARYRRIAEATSEGAWVLDAAARTTFVNARMAAMLGASVPDLEGAALYDFLDDRGRGVASAHLARRAGDDVGHSELKLFRRDGTACWARFEWTPVVERGAFRGTLAMVTDLTERKRDEAARRSLEDQLRHAQKMEAVGRLAGGVAHDFNNILSVILSVAELNLEDLAPGAPARADLELIRDAGRRAADLTRQLLTFSRQQVVETKVFDLNELLRALEPMLQRVMGEDIDLAIRLPDDEARVRADRGSLEQVVMNLVVNARDAMPRGGKLTIEVGTAVIDAAYEATHHGVDAGAYVVLAVTDNGVGMDRATQARIFEPYFTTKDPGKGTGLGLATVFGIVRQSGGAVWVYSELAHGTTFKIYLPRAAGDTERVAAAGARAAVRGSETVLLVEDEDAVRAVVRLVLSRNGYTVLEARRGADALRLAAAHTGAIDLVLSDVVMPEMSGPDLARALAAQRPGLRVLYMSGYTDDSVVRHGLLDGTLAFLQKPITPDALARKVREVLDAPPPPLPTEFTPGS